MSHTPTPWKWSQPFGEGFAYVDDTKHDNIEETGNICTVWSGNNNAEANAAFIVRACNNHDRLVEALANLVISADGLEADNDSEALEVDREFIDYARTILAEVEK